MNTSSSLLSSALAKNLTSAAMAGLVTYLRPTRIPRWARRGLMATNTAGTGAAMLAGQGSSGAGPTGAPAPFAGLLGNRSAPIGNVGSALAAVTGGVGLLTSAPGLKLDAKVEQMLLKRGVGNPRLLMAVGAVGLVFVAGLLTDHAAKVAERKTYQLQEKRGSEQLPGAEH